MGTTNITRRQSVALMAAGALASWPKFAFADAVSSGVVATRNGRVRGLQADGISAFWGVPFGGDTSKRRFQRAVPTSNWAGVRECVRPGAQAPQMELFAAPPPSVAASPAMAAVQAMFDAAGAGGLAESEDCLFLNVFTPDASRP